MVGVRDGVEVRVGVAVRVGVGVAVAVSVGSGVGASVAGASVVVFWLMRSGWGVREVHSSIPAHLAVVVVFSAGQSHSTAT